MTHDDTAPDKPAHTSGTPKGESRAQPLSARMTRKADDATGINVADRQPISRDMPWLPPA